MNHTKLGWSLKNKHLSSSFERYSLNNKSLILTNDNEFWQNYWLPLQRR